MWHRLKCEVITIDNSPFNEMPLNLWILRYQHHLGKKKDELNIMLQIMPFIT